VCVGIPKGSTSWPHQLLTFKLYLLKCLKHSEPASRDVPKKSKENVNYESRGQLGMVAYTCDLSYSGGRGRRIKGSRLSKQEHNSPSDKLKSKILAVLLKWNVSL
jgi:hypothetical protein